MKTKKVKHNPLCDTDHAGECRYPESAYPNLDRPQHTPGPWEINGVERCYVQNRKGQCLADCISQHIDYDEAQANARLIAAAPELLEALKAVSHNPTQYDKWMPTVVEAIAKAEGR